MQISEPNELNLSQFNILIVVDNLRVGGIQRQAIDQMYALADSRSDATLLILNKKSTFSNSNFIEIEKKIIKKKKVKIVFCPLGTIKQIVFMQKIINKKSFNLVIDYSLSGSMKLWIGKLFSRNFVPIHCVIEQLASLSAPTQRYKRMLFAQFATRLFANSIYYSRDWDFYVQQNIFTKMLFHKKLTLIRNGVYLQRLNLLKKQSEIKKFGRSQKIRFIFLGRLRSWKGLDRFLVLDNFTAGKASFLVLAPDNDIEIFELLKNKFGERIQIMIGKTPADFIPQTGDVHVYAVNYGPKIRFIESISTNCLEMALVGVPSLITKGGSENWPELVKEKLVFEVDWDNFKSFENALAQLESTIALRRDWANVEKALSVNTNLSEHSQYIK